MHKKIILLGSVAIIILGLTLGFYKKIDSNKKSVSTLSKVAKKAAITFDDGPNKDYTAELLKGLKERGVCATFFLLGAEAEKYPELVKQIDNDGHVIGTHSYQHVNLCNLTDEAAIEQVEKTNAILQELTGECPQFIRPPFGCWKKDLDYKTDMIEVLWDVDPLDWNTNNTSVIVKRVLEEVEDGAIILMHDASKSSVEAALQIIDCMKKDGYIFATVEELVLD